MIKGINFIENSTKKLAPCQIYSNLTVSVLDNKPEFYELKFENETGYQTKRCFVPNPEWKNDNETVEQSIERQSLSSLEYLFFLAKATKGEEYLTKFEAKDWNTAKDKLIADISPLLPKIRVNIKVLPDKDLKYGTIGNYVGSSMEIYNPNTPSTLKFSEKEIKEKVNPYLSKQTSSNNYSSPQANVDLSSAI